jgi:hypothetical protein
MEFSTFLYLGYNSDDVSKASFKIIIISQVEIVQQDEGTLKFK